MKMMKKKVLIVHKGYPLKGNAGDKVRTINMALSLQKMGCQVFLLAFFTKDFFSLREEKKKMPVGIKGIFIYSLPNRVRLEKIAELMRGLWTALICRIYSIDVIQSELASAATAARFVPNIPLITDFHSDTVPELEMNSFSKNVVKHAARENKYALKRSHSIITVSQNLATNLKEYGLLPQKSYILPCNFNAEPFLEVSLKDRNRLREQQGLKDKIVLCYSGGLHKWQCVNETLELIIRLKRLNSAYFLCLFTNDDITPYQDLLDKLDGAYLIKGLKKNEVALFLSMIDVGFVLRANSLVNLNASPTKSSEYLASGAIIVTTRYAGDVPRQVEDSGCGIVVDELEVDDEQVMEINEQIVNYHANYDEYARKAKEYVYINRTWNSNEEKLVQIYEELSL